MIPSRPTNVPYHGKHLACLGGALVIYTHLSYYKSIEVGQRVDYIFANNRITTE